jgi:hypothetical protein
VGRVNVVHEEAVVKSILRKYPMVCGAALHMVIVLFLGTLIGVSSAFS